MEAFFMEYSLEMVVVDIIMSVEINIVGRLIIQIKIIKQCKLYLKELYGEKQILKFRYNEKFWCR